MGRRNSDVRLTKTVTGNNKNLCINLGQPPVKGTRKYLEYKQQVTLPNYH